MLPLADLTPEITANFARSVFSATYQAYGLHSELDLEALRRKQSSLTKFPSLTVEKSPLRKKKRRLYESPYVTEMLPPVHFKSKKPVHTSIFADLSPSSVLRSKLFIRSPPLEDLRVTNPVASSPAFQTVSQPCFELGSGRPQVERQQSLKMPKTPVVTRISVTASAEHQRARQTIGLRSTKEPLKDNGGAKDGELAEKIAPAKDTDPTKDRKPRKEREQRKDEVQSKDRLDVMSSETQNIVMKEFTRRSRLPSKTRVFVMNSKDDHIRRALLSRGWVENSNSNSGAFHLKWAYSDTDADYKELRPGQFFNHFANNRSLTTKSGLCRALRGVCTYGINTDSFFPRCYDLGDLAQMEEFKLDYLRTAVLTVVKKHSVLDKPCLVNQACLQRAVKYAARLLATFEDDCESKAKYAFMQSRTSACAFTQEDLDALVHYSKLDFPIDEATLDKRLYNKRWEVEHAWRDASHADLKTCADLTAKLQQHMPQLRMEGCLNLWVIKPGQNSKGSGVMLTASLAEVVERGLNMQSRVVQKYVERPLLLPSPKGPVKFDMRQWVLVTSFEPLKVYVFNSCYLRLCLEPFDLAALDPLRHLTNFSLQKSIAKAEADTVWSLEQFIAWLAQEQPGVTWAHSIFPRLTQLIVETIEAVSASVEPRSVLLT
jgi:hypothetical protein